MKFEDKLKKLEEITEVIRNGESSIEESIESFEKGMKLAKELEETLDAFEKKVEIIIDDGNDSIKDFPLE